MAQRRYWWTKWGTEDWLINPQIRSLSPVTRALLADVRCMTHWESPRIGYLLLPNGAQPTAAQLARRLGLTPAEVTRGIREALDSGALVRGEDGAIVDPTINQVEHERAEKAEKCSVAGRAGGGNPALHRHVTPFDAAKGQGASPLGAPLGNGDGIPKGQGASPLGAPLGNGDVIPKGQGASPLAASGARQGPIVLELERLENPLKAPLPVDRERRGEETESGEGKSPAAPDAWAPQGKPGEKTENGDPEKRYGEKAETKKGEAKTRSKAGAPASAQCRAFKPWTALESEDLRFMQAWYQCWGKEPTWCESRWNEGTSELESWLAWIERTQADLAVVVELLAWFKRDGRRPTVEELARLYGPKLRGKRLAANLTKTESVRGESGKVEVGGEVKAKC